MVSRFYIQGRNLKVAIEFLFVIYERLGIPPVSFDDLSFFQLDHNNIVHFLNLTNALKTTRNLRLLPKIFDISTPIFHKTSELIQGQSEIELEKASPFLIHLHHSNALIPGSTLTPITIDQVLTSISIFSTKLRPRKITFLDSDGKHFAFLLKSNEDTRLDQRIMQLFFFINRAIRNPDSPKITLKNVIPLSFKEGLISWFEKS
jgi:FKBP12-rapamycin complex-associated protein